MKIDNHPAGQSGCFAFMFWRRGSVARPGKMNAL